ncbi:MAG: CbiX/SirB N-terminal domain-containing protein [Aggregatilineales bacterium]
MTARTALVLAGHGSHISPHTAGIVWRYVDMLRSAQIADEITACFWKEQPAFAEVLNTLTADHITIVPVFTAQGFFTQTIIPTEMGLQGDITYIGERVVHYAKTLGEHPDLTSIIQQRVATAIQTHALDPLQSTVAIIGHGTRRNSQSQQATRDQVQLLTDKQLVTHVIDAYLDDTPDIPSIYTRAKTEYVVVVPFFLAPGSHVSIDVPNALGLEEGQQTAFLNGKHIIYTDPVGTDDSLVQLIIDLARAAGLPEHPTSQKISAWDHTPSAGNETLIEAVRQSGELTFGDLVLSASAVYPREANRNAITLNTPQALRDHIRENPFRPLATSTDLPRDWIIPVDQIEDIPAIVDTIYPATISAWSAGRKGCFVVGSLEKTIARQKGNFQQLNTLPDSAITQTITAICGACVKRPAWAGEKVHRINETTHKDIPCPEPCNFWLSKALETQS